MWFVVVASAIRVLGLASRDTTLAGMPCGSGNAFSDAFCTGFDQVRTLAGVSQAEVINVNNPADCPALVAANASLWDLMIFNGFVYGECIAASSDAPTKLVEIDGCDSSAANTMCALFAEDQSAFAAGFLAGSVSAGVVGVVGGAPFPPVQRFVHGYGLGVRASCPNCRVEGRYIYGFGHLEEGQRYAEHLVTELGADVVFGAGGFTGSMAIRKAAELGAWVIGVDVDEYTSTFAAADPSVRARLITSAVKKNGIAAVKAVNLVLDGLFTGHGTTLVMDYANLGVGLAECHDACATLPPDAFRHARAMERKLATRLQSTGLAGITVPLGLDTNTWTEVEPLSRAPPFDVEHAVGSYVDMMGLVQHLAMFGADGLWILDIGGLLWMRAEPGTLSRGEAPPPLAGACVVGVGQTLYIWGGRDAEGARSAALFRWVPQNYYFMGGELYDDWTKLDVLGPEARDGHTCTTNGDSVVMFGGRTENFLWSDAWMFDGIAWSELAAGPMPARRSAGVVSNGTALVVVGGLGVEGALSDAWGLDEHGWTELTSLPVAVADPIAGLLGGRLVVWAQGAVEAFGRHTAGAYAFVWDEGQWQSQQQAGTPMRGAVGLVAGGVVWQMGGADGMLRASRFELQPECFVGEFFDTSRCTACAVGTYALTRGLSSCAACSPGWFAAATGASACDFCPHGTFAAQPGASTCEPCAAGASAKKLGLAACEACTAGTHAALRGASECKLCESGTYQDETGKSLCLDCPATFTTESPGATRAGQCVCAPEHFTRVETGTCAPCSDKMAGCQVYNASAASVRSMPGFYLAPGEHEPSVVPAVYTCLSKVACPGENFGSCPEGAEPGRLNIACSRCETAYYWNGEYCSACSNSVGRGIGGLIAAVLLFVGCMVAAYHAHSFSTGRQNADIVAAALLVSTMLTLVTMLSAVATVQVPWPEPIKSIFGVIRLLVADLSFLKMQCHTRWSDTYDFAFILSLPAFAAMGSALIAIVGRVKDRRMVVNGFLGIVNVLFLPIVLVILTPTRFLTHPWACTRGFGDDTDVLSCIEYSVLALPYIEAGSSEHTSLVWLSVVAGLAYAVPFIAACCWATFHMHVASVVSHQQATKLDTKSHAARLSQVRRQSATSLATSMSSLATSMSSLARRRQSIEAEDADPWGLRDEQNPPETKLQKRLAMTMKGGDIFVCFRFLIFKFRPEKTYWGVILVCRSVILGVVPSLAPAYAHVQILIFTIMFLVFLVGTSSELPWKIPILNAIDISFMVVLLMVICVGNSLVSYGEGHLKNNKFYLICGDLVLVVFCVLVGLTILIACKLGHNLYSIFAVRYVYSAELAARVEAEAQETEEKHELSIDKLGKVEEKRREFQFEQNLACEALVREKMLDLCIHCSARVTESGELVSTSDNFAEMFGEGEHHLYSLCVDASESLRAKNFVNGLVGTSLPQMIKMSLRGQSVNEVIEFHTYGIPDVSGTLLGFQEIDRRILYEPQASESRPSAVDLDGVFWDLGEDPGVYEDLGEEEALSDADPNDVVEFMVNVPLNALYPEASTDPLASRGSDSLGDEGASVAETAISHGAALSVRSAGTRRSLRSVVSVRKQVGARAAEVLLRLRKRDVGDMIAADDEIAHLLRWREYEIPPDMLKNWDEKPLGKGSYGSVVRCWLGAIGLSACHRIDDHPTKHACPRVPRVFG